MNKKELEAELKKLKNSIDKIILMLGKDKYEKAVKNTYEKRG